ncbi:MAG: hypothetical protein GEU96_22870 [Propionibacteriales bacterium]|nr:hypothetical protein [Propionibacteriales bacterium]
MTTDAPRDFTFAVPGDWWRISLEDAVRQRAQINALVKRSVRGRPDRDTLGPQLRQLINDAVQTFDSKYAIECYLAQELADNVPIAASLVVSVYPPSGPEISRLTVEAGLLAAGRTAAECAAIDVDAGRTVRTRQQVTADVDGTHTYATEGVTYSFFVPGTTGLVVLAFSTPMVNVAAPLVALFDSMAQSFRWVW